MTISDSFALFAQYIVINNTETVSYYTVEYILLMFQLNLATFDDLKSF